MREYVSSSFTQVLTGQIDTLDQAFGLTHASTPGRPRNTYPSYFQYKVVVEIEHRVDSGSAIAPAARALRAELEPDITTSVPNRESAYIKWHRLWRGQIDSWELRAVVLAEAFNSFLTGYLPDDGQSNRPTGDMPAIDERVWARLLPRGRRPGSPLSQD